MFDTLIVFLKAFFEKVNFEKKSAEDNKGMKKYPACNDLSPYNTISIRHKQMSNDMRFLTMCHFDKCRLSQACAASF